MQIFTAGIVVVDPAFDGTQWLVWRRLEKVDPDVSGSELERNS